jgi:hypothetical protein
MQPWGFQRSMQTAVSDLATGVQVQIENPHIISSAAQMHSAQKIHSQAKGLLAHGLETADFLVRILSNRF